MGLGIFLSIKDSTQHFKSVDQIAPDDGIKQRHWPGGGGAHL